MQYLDSNVFLYSALYSPTSEPKAKRAKEMLQKIENGEITAATSTLTWDEVVWVATKLLGRADGIAQGQKLLGFPNIEFINVDEGIIAQAQALMAKYKLSPRDSIHVASALSKKTKTIVSDDEDFDQIKEIKRIPLK
ncbi:MAG: type II toxin-antitoxin system VapC family toxin [Candidatus Bathyarchaeia archaeon]